MLSIKAGTLTESKIRALTLPTPLNRIRISAQELSLGRQSDNGEVDFSVKHQPVERVSPRSGQLRLGKAAESPSAPGEYEAVIPPASV